MLAHKDVTQYSFRQLSGHRKNKQKSQNYMFEADFCRCAQHGVCYPILTAEVAAEPGLWLPRHIVLLKGVQQGLFQGM